MKTCYIIAVSIFSIVCRAQEITNFEKHGSALNISGGVCYYKYVGYSSAVLHADYEIQIGNSLTVAPSVSVYSYDGHVLWGDDFNQARDYSYSEIVIPLGLKVTFYFDKLLHAGELWDFYTAGSLGTNVRKTTWEKRYNGKNNIEPGTGPVYIDLHIGSEFHISKVIGLTLDVSTAISTIGLAIHI